MPVIRAILFSLLVHFLLILGMSLIPRDPDLKQKNITEIELVTSEKKNPKLPSRQIVRNPFKPDELQAQDDTTLARFLSEQKHRVKQETRATQTGLTKNQDTEKNTNQKIQDQKQQQAQLKSLKEKPNNIKAETERNLAKEGFRPWNPGEDLKQKNHNSVRTASTVSDRLPTDVSVGSFTSLNTDQYTYYTFYARIEELIRFRWETRVQSSIDSFDRSTVLNVLGQKTWISNVEFLLSPDGRLVKSMIMKESGVSKFDMAAINAFKEAAMFPNPPQELVEEDGYIHLKYAFAVYLNPSSMVGR